MVHDMSHSIIAPSSAPIWGFCSGSVILQASIPDEETDESREGTAAHWVAEQMLKSFSEPKSESCIVSLSQLPEFAPNGVHIDDDMFYGAREYVNDVLKVCNIRGLLRKLNIEARIYAPRIHKDSWGTIDLWVFDEKTGDLFIWDYKYGHGFVEVYENLQMVNYAIGIIDYLCDIFGPDLETYIKVHMRIAQPRCYSDEGSIREWVTTGVKLRPLANQLHNQSHEAFSKNATYKSGDHCKYCKGKLQCDSFKRSAYNAFEVSNNLPSHPLTPSELSTHLHIVDKVYDRIELFKKSLEAEAEALIRSGQLVPGFGIKSKKGRKVWHENKEQDVITLFQLFGHDLESSIKIPTPNQCSITAVSLGIDDTVLDQYTKFNSGSTSLTKLDEKAVEKVFKKRG